MLTVFVNGFMLEPNAIIAVTGNLEKMVLGMKATQWGSDWENCTLIQLGENDFKWQVAKAAGKKW